MKYNGWFTLCVVLQSSLWSLFTSSPTPFDAYNADYKSSQYNVYRLSYRRSSTNLEEAKKLKLYWKYHLLASCSECSLAYRFSYSALRGRGNKDSRMSRTFFRRLCKSFYLILSDLRYSVLIPWSTLLRSPDWVVREVSRHVYNKQQRRRYDYKCMPQQQIKINIPQVFMRVKTLILTLKRAQGKKTIRHVINYRPGREGIPYERGGYARRKFWIKPLKETNLGVAQPFLTPKSDHFKLWLHESSK